MARLFLFLALLVPLLEIFVFVEAGRAVGAPAVVLATVLTAAGGIALVRLQGFETLRKARAEIDAGRPPVAEMLHGALLVAAGLLLLVPGFVTDLAGALLLVPPLRRPLVDALAARAGKSRRGATIEAEFWHEEGPGAPPPPPLDRDRDRNP